MTYPHTTAFDRFATWMAAAETSELNDPNAVYLASVDMAEDGTPRPSVRTVLLKEVTQDGFVFYTNYTSRKGRELLTNPHAALLFHWKSRERQVRIEGRVTPVGEAVADAYFASRARRSQLGAHASLQSTPLDSQATLEGRLAALTAQYAGQDIPRPAHWSGFELRPERFEFWQAGDNRLHEREVLTRLNPAGQDGWQGQLLYP